MTDERLEKLEASVPRKDPGNPPLHLWQPELSGDIDILIKRDGSWWHEGAPIRRQPLVNLFASILRREADGEYYLVTPVEKWRIKVEGLPLLVVDFDVESQGEDQQRVVVTTNVDRRYTLGRDYPLMFPDEEGAEDEIPAVAVDHGLIAQFNRAAWYRLVDAAEEEGGRTGLRSNGLFFPLTR